MNSEQKGFTIGLCTAGKRELRISGRSWEIVPGCLFILIPQQFTESISCSEDFSARTLSAYSARTLSASLEAILEHPSPVDINILNITFLHPVIRLSEERAAGLLEYYDFISRHTGRSDNVYDKELHKTLLYALMLEISDIYLRRPERGDQAPPGTAHRRLLQAADRPLPQRAQRSLLCRPAQPHPEIFFRSHPPHQRTLRIRLDSHHAAERQQTAAPDHRHDHTGDIGGAGIFQPVGLRAVLPPPYLPRCSTANSYSRGLTRRATDS